MNNPVESFYQDLSHQKEKIYLNKFVSELNQSQDLINLQLVYDKESGKNEIKGIESSINLFQSSSTKDNSSNQDYSQEMKEKMIPPVLERIKRLREIHESEEKEKSQPRNYPKVLF